MPKVETQKRTGSRNRTKIANLDAPARRLPRVILKLPNPPRVSRTKHVTNIAMGGNSKRATAPIDDDPDDEYLSDLTSLVNSRCPSPEPGYSYDHEEVSTPYLSSIFLR
jgi:hypothetical protein